MNDTMSIFDYLYPKYKITKPIRLIEMFSGYGSQALALKYLGVEFEHWKICEWAVKSIQAYKDIHFPDIKYWNKLEETTTPKEKLIDLLYDFGISQNYNEPMTKEQIKRLSYEQLARIYENIMITHNLVNIQQVKGEDLEIEDKDKYDYILTYSFPCQDLSLAGKGKGMSDTSTRSGMLWEVERILTECKDLGSLPQILLMENVPQVHSQDNLEDFNKWKLRLEELGYKNYFQDLIATDYGIPQTRNRCFMVSILGDYSYTFPKPISLKLKLKDMLEEEINIKYYLSKNMMNYLLNKNINSNFKVFKPHIEGKEEIAHTIMTSGGNRADDNFIVSNLKIGVDEKYYLSDKAINGLTNQMSKDHKPNIIDTEKEPNKPFSTITCGYMKQGHYETYLKIKNATKKGYLEATEGDGIDLSQPNSETRRGRVQKNSIQTLTTQNNLGVVNNELKIRKLTPRECFRLMGVKDEDYEKCAKNQSDSSLYHLAGDSICISCLIAIFGELLNIDWKEKLNELLESKGE